MFSLASNAAANVSVDRQGVRRVTRYFGVQGTEAYADLTSWVVVQHAQRASDAAHIASRKGPPMRLTSRRERQSRHVGAGSSQERTRTVGRRSPADPQSSAKSSRPVADRSRRGVKAMSKRPMAAARPPQLRRSCAPPPERTLRTPTAWHRPRVAGLATGRPVRHPCVHRSPRSAAARRGAVFSPGTPHRVGELCRRRR